MSESRQTTARALSVPGTTPRPLKSSELSPKKDGCKSDSAGVQGPVPAPKTWCWEAQTASFQCPAYLHRDSTVTAMTGNEMQGIIFGAVQLSNRSSGGLGQIVSA